MILTPHILVGAAIGYKVHNFWLVAVFSIIVHFILDMIPHKEYEINGVKNGKLNSAFVKDFLKVAVDGLIGLLLVVLLTKDFTDLNYMAVGIISAGLPDFLLLLSYVSRSRVLNIIRRFHEDIVHIYKNRNAPPWLKIGSQITAVILGIVILLQ